MLLNIALYVFAAIGVAASAFCIWDALQDRAGADSPPRGIPRPTGERKQGYDRTTPKLIPSTQTQSLLEKLHKIEYDLLAEGSHDAFRHDPNAHIPDVVYDELDYMDARGCVLIIQSLNYIRQHINSEPLEVMADFDSMLRRIIQRHEDDFNYPPTNFRC